MHLPLFIAGRYLFAAKSHNVINIIAAISAFGMAVGTAALILILSVYNGFDSIIRDNISDVDSDFLITPSSGKCLVPEGEAFDWLYDCPRAVSISSVVQDNVFIRYEGRIGVATAKGVDSVYEEESALRSHVVSGEYSLHRGDVPQALVGSVLASKMRINPVFVSPLELNYPDRKGSVSVSDPLSSLKSAKVYPSGVLSISSDIDAGLLIVPLETMRALLGYRNGEVSGVEVRTPSLSKRQEKSFCKEISEHFGDGFSVKTRVEQHQTLYKMMRYEKAAIFLILLFVVIVVAFNIFASLSMLWVEKKEDVFTLRAMGADDAFIRRVFIYEGWLVSLLGMAAGLVFGIVIAFAQQRFGLVKLPGNFLVDAYPVVLKSGDVLLTAAGVALVGLFTAALPFLKTKTQSI